MTEGKMSPGKPLRRTSRQRNEIARLLAESNRFWSAQEVYDKLREQGKTTGLATVYRGLNTLVETGFIDSIRNPEGERVFRKCSTGHHHHLICKECGKTIEISATQIETWANRIAEENGFTSVNHNIELTGLCASCTPDA